MAKQKNEASNGSAPELSNTQRNEVRLIVIRYMAIVGVALLGSLFGAFQFYVSNRVDAALERIKSKEVEAEQIAHRMKEIEAGFNDNQHSRVVAFLSDFGTGAYYVGNFRGRIQKAFPGTRLIDISHEITPFDIPEGAWTLYKAAESFPDGSIFLAIVNPGADLERSRFVVTKSPRFYFIGADRALFDHVVAKWGMDVAHRLAPTLNDDTFGTNTFSPIIKRLLEGASVEVLVEENLVGEKLQFHGTYPYELDAVKLGGRIENNVALGYVCAIDRWGNLQTNIPHDGGFFIERKEFDVTLTVSAHFPDSEKETEPKKFDVSFEKFVFGRSYDAGKKEAGVIIQQDQLIQVAIFLESLEQHVLKKAYEHVATVLSQSNASNKGHLIVKISDGLVRITPR